VKPYRLMLGAAAAVAALLIMPGSAVGAPTFDNESRSHGGLCLGGEEIDDDALEVACSESQSRTSNDDTSASSESTPVGVLETIQINEARCVDPPEEPGDVSEQEPESQIENDEGTVGVFTSQCEADAHKTNNSESSSETTLLFASQDDSSLVVGHSKAGQPDEPEGAKKTRTTRGTAQSYAEFTAVEAESGESSLTVLHCESWTQPGTQETRTEADFLDANGDEVEELDPLAEALCPLFVSSEASKG
jgi:hypothetical protein